MWNICQNLFFDILDDIDKPASNVKCAQGASKSFSTSAFASFVRRNTLRTKELTLSCERKILTERISS